MGFILKCDNCSTKVKLENNSRLKKILISGTIDYSSEKIITCQECGHSLTVN